MHALVYGCWALPHDRYWHSALADSGFCYSDKPSEVEGFPQRSWSIEVWLVNDKGEQVPATIFDKVTYHLHPSFGARATQGML